MSDGSQWCRHGEDAQAMLELALVLPFVLLLVCGVMDFGLLFSANEGVIGAARSGAIYATTYPTAWSNASSADLSTIEGQVQSNDGTASIPNVDQSGSSAGMLITYLTSTGGPCGHFSQASDAWVVDSGGSTEAACIVPGNLIQVKVTYQYRLITPVIRVLFPGGITLASTATYVEEQ